MKKQSILLVDDDREVLAISRSFLSEGGVEVCCAESGEQALKEVSGNSFTHMLTDYNMPGMNGLELARKVREIAPDIRIIITTGHPSQELSEQAAELGISTILAKPIPFPVILTLLNQDSPTSS